MANSKATKKALFMSMLSLLLCFTMLMGATFAWFTDTVQSTGNKIQAGNLDVQLLMDTGSGYQDISDSTSPIFGAGSIAANNNAETLWEPGKTQVAYLAIKNAGSLSLKYRVDVDVRNELKDLYKVMNYAIIPDAEYDDVTSWDVSKAEIVKEGINPTKFADIQLNPGEEHHFALAIHMQEEATNEYQGGAVEFDVIVNAAQIKAESDSFGNTYDEDAKYDTDTPVALTKTLSKEAVLKNPEGEVVLDENLSIDTTGSKMGTDLGEIKLDTAYQFQPNMSYDEVLNSEYKNWHADFVVSANKPISSDKDRIALAGYYSLWCDGFNDGKWVALTNKGIDIIAGEEIRLVDGMGEGRITVSFKDICQYGNDGIGFLCGAQEINDGLEPGTTLTVALRLYEATGGGRDTETGKYITVGEYKYTFE